MNDSISARLAGMDLARKVGQTLMIGCDGTALTPELRRTITDLHVGGVIFFERNVDSPQALAQFSADLQAAAQANGDPPLLIAMDQEGGRVARLKQARGFTEFPGAMAVAATGRVENARHMAAALAAELRAVGINVDLAPDLDVNNNPDNPVIGIRSFGSQPQRVAEYGVAFVQGLQDAGVLAVGKHFPGHGDTGVDSHIDLPTVPHARARLDAVELLPFKAAMAAGVAGILTAHVTFPAIDPTPSLAATLSPRVLTDLARTELGFDGLLFTDSLEMGALARSGYPVPLAAATALLAGADICLFNRGHDLHRQAHAGIMDWLAQGKIPQARLDASAARVLTAKARLGLFDAPPAQFEAQTLDAVGGPTHKALSRRMARQALTLLRNRAGLLPLAPGVRPTVIEMPFAAGLAAALGGEILAADLDPAADQIRGLVEQARARQAPVIMATADARQHPGQVNLVRALGEAGLSPMVVAVSGPYDLMAFPEVATFVAAYGANPPTLEALAALFSGALTPQGRLPVDLPGLHALGSGLTDFAPA